MPRKELVSRVNPELTFIDSAREKISMAFIKVDLFDTLIKPANVGLMMYICLSNCKDSLPCTQIHIFLKTAIITDV